jgi:predicted aspartyl protease
VASFRTALLAHEEGHFVASEQVTAAQTKTLKATGATQRAAVAALKTLAQQQIKDGQAALDKARDDYDNLTKHGANQAAVGGTNVHLACPRKAPESKSGGATSPGPEAEEGE